MPIAFTMWLDRLDELAHDLERVEALLAGPAFAGYPDLEGRLGLLLGPLGSRVAKLRTSGTAGLTVAHWHELAELRHDSRASIVGQLELLGGLSLAGAGDDGATERAAAWLNDLRARAGLDRKLYVISGRGPVLEPTGGVVRLPFLDWDDWTVPLLARAIGLHAATVDPYRAALDGVIEPLAGQDERRRAFFRHLFADMLATALAGPAYTLALFALELDYRVPAEAGLADPDQIEDRDRAPRFLPSPVQRCVAVLTVLRALNEDRQGRVNARSPYAGIIGQLETCWRECVATASPYDPLDDEQARLGPSCRAIYDAAIASLLPVLLRQAAERWSAVEALHRAIDVAPGPPARPPASPFVRSEVLAAIWRRRLRVPDQSENLLRLGAALLKGDAPSPIGGDTRELARAVGLIRHQRLTARLMRLNAMLRPRLQTERSSTVAGRLLRLLSEQAYRLDQIAPLLLKAPKMQRGIWMNLASLEDVARPLAREALEFIGGVLVREGGHDHEPASANNGCGPPICILADELLSAYARATGVSWSAHTVPGHDPFLATDTDVIRVRFPDWSLWNLPLMAHEFGHVAARATPEFLRFQAQLPEADAGRPKEIEPQAYAEARRLQAEEFFADLFATYTLGPAFACSGILLQFSPAGAYIWRDKHPTHDERVGAVLQLLGLMNDRTRAGPGRPGCYDDLLQRLGAAWEPTVAAAGATPAEPAAHEARRRANEGWVRRLYTLIDKSYRLAGGYTPERWQWAQEAAPRLLDPGYITDLTNQIRRGQTPPSMIDMLNALWYARLTRPDQTTYLMDAALALGRAHAEITR